MTKLAIKRRQCLRAKKTLIRRWPRLYSEDSFESADEYEFNCLPGTPLYWSAAFMGDADCRPAVEELRHIVWAESIDWSRIAQQDFTRDRFAMYGRATAHGVSTNQCDEWLDAGGIAVHWQPETMEIHKA